MGRIEQAPTTFPFEHYDRSVIGLARVGGFYPRRIIISLLRRVEGRVTAVGRRIAQSQTVRLSAMLCLIGVLAIVSASAQTASVGRFAPLGVTSVAAGWSADHPSDEHFIYALDSATGRIYICGDVTGACRSIAESDRQAAGVVPERFVGLGVTNVTKAWKSLHANDDHLIYSMDSATGAIQICGDLSDTCTSVSNISSVAANSPPKIIIIYRRAESAALAGRVYDRLVDHYGKGAVFLDIYSIPLGVDWIERVEQASGTGAIIVVLVDHNWIGRMLDGSVRIDQKGDPVRLEIEMALRAHVPIFPVLIDDAIMPPPSELPNSLKPFSTINAATIHSGLNFDTDMAKLLRSIDQRLGDAAAISRDK